MKAVVYDLNGTLVPAVGGKAMEMYARRMRDALEPLLELSDEEVKKALEEKGAVVVEGKNLNKKIAEFALEAVKKPKRGTKAREVYYDLLEIAYERNGIDGRALPDALAEGNTIDREKKQGYSIVALSRGTDALLAKVLKLSGLSGRIERIYSTLQFGGEKTERAYAGVYEKLISDGLEPARFYEDEFPNVMELFRFGLTIAKKDYPFEIVWVDRKSEGRKKQLEEMKRDYEKLAHKGWKKFGEAFRTVTNLL